MQAGNSDFGIRYCANASFVIPSGQIACGADGGVREVKAAVGFRGTPGQVDDVNPDPSIATPGIAPANDSDTRRERSTIDFPYSDLNDTISVAKAIQGDYGQSGTPTNLRQFSGTILWLVVPFV